MAKASFFENDIQNSNKKDSSTAVLTVLIL